MAEAAIGAGDDAGARFAAYARCYDLLYRDKDYAAEAGYVAALVRRRLPQARRILELGCGTGAHAEHLARLGFEVHGVDVSEAMLERAAARRAGWPAEWRERTRFGPGDARSYRSGKTYDAVLSLFHVFSYQTGNADLRAAYATAAAHLEPGGVLLFDHWSGPAVLTERPAVRVRRLEGDGLRVLRIAEPRLDLRRNVCDVHYTLLIDDLAGGGSHRFDETHPMRYFFEPELALVEGDGWRDAQSLAWLADREPGAADWAAVRVLTRA